jgi:hypothetical protein
MVAGIGSTNKMGFTFGYPTALQTRQPISKIGDVLTFKASSFSCSPLPVEQWPQVPADSPAPDPDVDVFTAYDTDAPAIIVGKGVGKLPDPQGVSGGGVWQTDTTHEGGLWSPECLKLFAIQSTWHQPGKYLRATQIRHWLNLLCQKCPELIPAVEEGVIGYRLAGPA